MWTHKLFLLASSLLSTGIFASPSYSLESRDLTAGVSACKGYKAQNVKESSTGLTATLTLIGEGCGIYGPDIQELKLEVDYQTGRPPVSHLLSPSCLLFPQSSSESPPYFAALILQIFNRASR